MCAGQGARNKPVGFPAGLFYYGVITENHLGGYFSGGDLATYCPSLWQWLIGTLNIKSVLDVGCAEGQASEFFKNLGCDILGIEGCSQAIENTVIPGNVIQWDFTTGSYQTKQYDLVWCSEVLEHIEEQYVNNILETICSGNVLAITAAPPGQNGYHHVNCQPQSYWIEKISKWGFRCDGKLTRMARSIAITENANSHFSRNGLIFTRYSPPKNDFVSLTFISGDVFANLSGVEVYLQSLSKWWPYHKVVFTHNLNPENRERLQDLDIEIVDVDPTSIKDITVDRWYHYWKFLCLHNYKVVLITDSKDILFQNNIREYIFPGEFLILCTEGQLHKDSIWNTEEQNKFQTNNNLRYSFMKQPVLNGGVQLGSANKIRDFAYLMHQGCRLGSKNVSDQAFLNYIYRDLLLDTSVIIADPATSRFCVTGESIANGVANHPVELENLSRYCLFHQWERTCFADQILGLQT